MGNVRNKQIKMRGKVMVWFDRVENDCFSGEFICRWCGSVYEEKPEEQYCSKCLDGIPISIRASSLELYKLLKFAIERLPKDTHKDKLFISKCKQTLTTCGE